MSVIGASAIPDAGDGGGRTRARWVILLLAVGVALDLLISGVLFYQNHQIQQAASSAHISRVAAYEACLSSGSFREADATRWAAVLKLLESSPPSPQLEKFIAGVQAANAQADQAPNCHALVP